jgi:hypothetical protein
LVIGGRREIDVPKTDITIPQGDAARLAALAGRDCSEMRKMMAGESEWLNGVEGKMHFFFRGSAR